MAKRSKDLFLDRPHRHESLAGPPRRLANRRRIDRCVTICRT
jgi:hypothetical protein